MKLELVFILLGLLIAEASGSDSSPRFKRQVSPFRGTSSRGPKEFKANVDLERGTGSVSASSDGLTSGESTMTSASASSSTSGGNIMGQLAAAVRPPKRPLDRPSMSMVMAADGDSDGDKEATSGVDTSSGSNAEPQNPDRISPPTSNKKGPKRRPQYSKDGGSKYSSSRGEDEDNDDDDDDDDDNGHDNGKGGDRDEHCHKGRHGGGGGGDEYESMFHHMTSDSMRNMNRIMGKMFNHMPHFPRGLMVGADLDDDDDDDEDGGYRRGSFASASAASDTDGYSKVTSTVSSDGKLRGIVSETKNGRTQTRRIGDSVDRSIRSSGKFQDIDDEY